MNNRWSEGAFDHEAPARIDAAFVTYRLEEAGATLLALPGTGHTTKLRISRLEIVQNAAEAYGRTNARVRPPVPSASRITRMDEALGWITLILQERYVIRRIVGARAGEPRDGAAFVFVAALGRSRGCRPQGGAALARPGHRHAGRGGRRVAADGPVLRPALLPLMAARRLVDALQGGGVAAAWRDELAFHGLAGEGGAEGQVIRLAVRADRVQPGRGASVLSDPPRQDEDALARGELDVLAALDEDGAGGGVAGAGLGGERAGEGDWLVGAGLEQEGRRNEQRKARRK